MSRGRTRAIFRFVMCNVKDVTRRRFSRVVCSVLLKKFPRSVEVKFGNVLRMCE